MTEYDFMEVAGPPPEGAICDFCSSPDVHWSFPCRDHKRETEHIASLVQSRDGSLRVEEMTLDGWQHGGWAACNPCHALILRGDRDRLAKRSAKRMMRKHPDMGFILSNLTAHVRRLHDQFWSNREGEPTYHPTRPTEDPTT